MVARWFACAEGSSTRRAPAARTFGAVAVVLAISQPGCRPPSADRAVAAQNAAPPEPEGPPRPARWSCHPAGERVVDALRLEAGAEVRIDRRGLRWTSDGGGSPFRSACHDSEPRLRRVLSWPTGRVLFVGERGEVLEATTPSGPLVPIASPPRTLVALAEDAGLLLGSDARGELFRFDGVRWGEVGGAPIAHELAGGSGGLLALGYPERLHRSLDGGASWQRLEGAPLGAIGLEGMADGTVWVDTVSGSRRWHARDGFLAPTEQWAETVEARVDGPRGPRASAVLAGRAAILASGYVEVEAAPSAETAGTSFTLLSGPLDGPLARSSPRTPGLTACAEATLAARPPWLAVACRDAKGLVLLASEDGGRSFRVGPTLPFVALPMLALTADGAILAFGEVPCDRGYCVRLLRLDGASLRVRAAELRGVPRQSRSHLPTSLDTTGGVPAFLAAGDGRAWTPFVSPDGGRTFRPRPLFGRTAAWTTFERCWEGAAQRALRVAPDGRIVVLAPTGTACGAIFDADGSMTRAVLPAPGERFVALSESGGRWLVHGVAADGTPFFRESLDDGRTFTRAEAPPAQVADLAPSLALACGTGGCLAGDSLVRLGWGGRDDLSPTAPADARPTASADATPRTSAPGTFVCSLSAGPLERLEGVVGGALPVVDLAFRGIDDWLVIGRTADGGAVVYRGQRGADGPRVVRERLLEGTPGAGWRIEAGERGVVALEATRGKGDEVALALGWIEPESRRVRRRKAVRLGLDPSVFGPGIRPYLHGVEVGVTSGGVFVHDRVRRVAHLVDVAGPAAGPLRLPRWPLGDLSATESEGFDAAPLALALHRDERGLVRALGAAPLGDELPHAIGIAPPDVVGRRVEVRRARAGGREGVVVHSSGRAWEPMTASFVAAPVDEDPPAVFEVPASAGSPPWRACLERDRLETPRVVAPSSTSARLPVVVAGRDDLAVAWTVLGGTLADPCVEGWVAESTPPGFYRAFLSSDLGRAWLVAPTATEALDVDVGTMACSFESDPRSERERAPRSP